MWEYVSETHDTRVERMKVEGGYVYKTSQRYYIYDNTGHSNVHMAMSTTFVPISLMEQVLDYKLKPNP